MEPLPSDRRRALQIAGVILAGGLGTALVVGLLWYSFRPDPTPPAQTVIEPAEETSVSAPVVPSQPTTDTTASVTPTMAPSAGSSARAAKVAFRLGDTVYVAGEDGSKPAKVLRAPEGPFSLSPDARTLAVVDGGALKLVDVASGRATSAGSAEAAAPVWTPDSSTVLFVRLGASTSMEIWRVGRTGEAAEKLTDGSAVSVSPDGRVIAARREASGSAMGAVLVSRAGGPFTPVAVAGQPTAVGAANDRLYVGVVNETGAASLLGLGVDGRGPRSLAGAPSGSVPAVWGAITVAPDGRHIAAVAVGDDGYSRVSVMDPNGRETRLSRRHDGYPRGWTADGGALLLIEGNAFQGESTTLVRMRIDGTNRQALVTGAE